MYWVDRWLAGRRFRASRRLDSFSGQPHAMGTRSFDLHVSTPDRLGCRMRLPGRSQLQRFPACTQGPAPPPAPPPRVHEGSPAARPRWRNEPARRTGARREEESRPRRTVAKEEAGGQEGEGATNNGCRWRRYVRVEAAVPGAALTAFVGAAKTFSTTSCCSVVSGRQLTDCTNTSAPDLSHEKRSGDHQAISEDEQVVQGMQLTPMPSRGICVMPRQFSNHVRTCGWSSIPCTVQSSLYCHR